MACLAAPLPTTSTNDRFLTASSMRPHSVSSDHHHGFRVVKTLGEGLQGKVLLAVDDNTHAQVAVKVPTAIACDSAVGTTIKDLQLLDRQVQSLKKERRAHRRVAHDNVIRYHRTVPGNKDNHDYVAMVTEYASNGDLFDVLANSGAFSEELAKFYFHQLISGIQACHDNGVVHRDIKPENILLDANFTLKICDFGLAAVVGAGNNSHESSVYDMFLRDISGTRLYMAPEVSSAARKPYCAAPVDIWSAGVVLFILVTGFPPFYTGASDDYLFKCVVNNRMDLFWKAHKDASARLSSSVKDLINLMLRANPMERASISHITNHVWLKDVDLIDRTKVYQAMAARRQ